MVLTTARYVVVSGNEVVLRVPRGRLTTNVYDWLLACFP
jgi:hypothetical protein